MATLKAQSAITADIFGSTLTLTFGNGKDLSINTDMLNADIAKQAMLHGLKQKLVDAAAIARNPDTGKSATIDDKYAAVAEVHARLTGQSPAWNKVRGGEGGSVGARNLLIRALMEAYPKRTREQLDTFLESKTKEEIAALRKNEKIAVIIARLQAAASDVDTDDLLGELESDDNDDDAEEQHAPKARGKKSPATTE